MKERNSNLGAKEQMIKNCGILGKVMQCIEALLIAIPILIIVVLVSVAGMIFMTGTEENMIPTQEELIVEDTADIVETEEITEQGVIKIIANIIKYVLTIVIVDILRRIFMSTKIKETPFTKDNVRSMRVLSIIAVVEWILAVLSGIGSSLIFVVTIMAISHVFKYGYELQVEADETL